MARGTLIAGIALGILGVVWSIFMTVVVAILVAAFGGSAGAVALIPAVGVPFGIVAIIGGLVGRKRDIAGSAALLLAGLLSILTAATLAVLLAPKGIPWEEVLKISVLMHWWAYILAIVGAALLLHHWKAVRAQS
jgi:hypothetical protein